MDALTSYGHLLIAGVQITVLLALNSLVIGLVLGIILASAKLSRHAWLSRPVFALTNFLRGIPEFLVLLLFYFGGTQLLSNLADRYVEVSPWGAGVAALSLIFGSYSSETFRGAFLAIPKGQVEAARAYGFSAWKCFWYIQMPQLWRIAIPGLGNLWQSLIKDTALVSVVGLDDLMRKSKQAAETTKEPFTFFFAASVLFLIITLVSMVVINQLEERANRGIRRA
jgi:polar amino acid transport system permease protein